MLVMIPLQGILQLAQVEEASPARTPSVTASTFVKLDSGKANRAHLAFAGAEYSSSLTTTPAAPDLEFQSRGLIHPRRKQRVIPRNLRNQPRMVVQLGHSGGISSAAFSPDGRFIVSGGAAIAERKSSDRVAILWETATGREIRRFVGHSDSINAVSFSRDGRSILTGSADSTARLWDVTTGNEIRQFVGHKGSVDSATFSPDGLFVLTESDDETVRLWDVAEGTEVHHFVGSWGELSPDGRFLLSGGHNFSDKIVRMWNATDGTEIHRFVGHWATFSPDGRYVLSSGNDSADETMRLWDIATKEEIRRFPAKGLVAFSPDGRSLLTGTNCYGFKCKYTPMRIWDVATGNEICRFDGYGPVAFSPDGSGILNVPTGEGENKDYGVQLFSSKTGEGIRFFSRAQEREIWLVESVAFSPKGEFVLIRLGEEEGGGSSGNTVGQVSLRLYNTASGKEVRRFESNSVGLPDDLRFSSNGDFVLSGNGVWDVRKGNEIQFTGYSFDQRKSTPFASDARQMAARRTFSNDGRFVLTTTGAIVQLWDTTTGREMLEVKGFFQVRAFWFSSNGHFFIFSDTANKREKTLSCWNTKMGETGRAVWEFSFLLDYWWKDAYIQYPRAQMGCTLSPDGSLFAIREYDEKHYDKSRIILLNANDGRVFRHLELPSGPRSILEFSPDSRSLVVDNKLYEVSTGQETREFKFNYGPKIKESFLETAIAFSPNGHFVLTSNGGIYQYSASSARQSMKLWDIATGTPLKDFPNQSAELAVFLPNGRFFLTTDYPNGKILHLWDVSSGIEVRRFEGHADSVTSVAVSPDGRFVLTGSGDHTERLWDISTGKELSRLVSFRNGDWIVATPNGKFDSNNLENLEGLHWVISDEPLTPLPIEIFMRDYYEPKLLPRILAREKFKPVRDFSTLNRTQPEVKITDIAPDSAETVHVTLEVANVKSEGQTSKLGFALESGVYDVRLFRDGQLVGYAPEQDGPIKLESGKSTVTFRNIRLPRRADLMQVEFSAYAFNSDRVKSETARQTYVLPQPLPTVKGRAYVISVGVNAYENPNLDLKFAANDARRLQSILSEKLKATGEYEAVVPITLLSDYEIDDGQRTVTTRQATKSNVKLVLDLLAGRHVDLVQLTGISNVDKLRPARPEDLVIISFASHGYADAAGRFYFVTYDTGNGARREVTSALLRKSISSDELSLWLRDVDAGELVMIVDACQSAAAVEGEGFKPGPMGSRGLGQLAYDKGMRILAATQADNAALENKLIKQGLLTYALVHDGIELGRADFKPEDKTITLGEWLAYGAQRVPELFDEVARGQVRSQSADANDATNIIFLPEAVNGKNGGQAATPRLLIQGKSVGQAGKATLAEEQIQRPSLFDFSRKRHDVSLLRKE